MKPLPAVPMPLSLSDLRRACRDARGARQRLEEALAAFHGAEMAFGLSSGRAALWLALRVLRRLRPERDRVIIPGYTCPTVGRSVMGAGLRGLCADISPGTLNLDPAQVAALIDERVLAVVAPHMFGVPCDVATLRTICDEHGAWLVEDLAQCVGGRWQDRLVGTFGGVGFLSMGRSKNLRGYEGGVLWVNRAELAEPMRTAFEELPEARSGSADRMRQAAITVLSAPRAWAVTKRLPGVRVGAEDQSFDPHPSKLADWQAGLGLISLERLAEHNERRRRVAGSLRLALGDVAGVRCQAVPAEAEPTHVRFATVLTDEAVPRRDELVARLQAANIDARAFYSRPMSDYNWFRSADGGRPCPNSRAAVAANLILPMHHAMQEPDVARTVAAVAGGLRQ
jgi:perosamine synthetase